MAVRLSTRLVEPWRDPAFGRRLGWAALAPVLAVGYGVVVVAVVAAAVLCVVGVGVLLLVPLLGLVRTIAPFERQQARDLLGVAVAREQPAAPSGLRGRLADADAWRVVAWLAARTLFGIVLAGVLVVAALSAVALVAMPFDPGYLQWGSWSSPGGPAFFWAPLVLVPLGLSVLALVAAVATVAAQLAPTALGVVADAERFEALRRRAQGLDDRNRLARELHDGIGHTLTVSLLQAEAAQALLVRDPEAAREALGVIERSCRQALDELDRALGMLRRSPEGDAPAPDLGDVDGLLDAVRSAGLDVRLDGPAIPPLRGPAGEAAYRVLQEGLTNVLRHAGPVAVRVRATAGERELRLEVVNGPATAGVGRRGPGAGTGLPGLAERCGLLGGRLASGPTPDGGWALTAVLPT